MQIIEIKQKIVKWNKITSITTNSMPILGLWFLRIFPDFIFFFFFLQISIWLKLFLKEEN